MGGNPQFRSASSTCILKLYSAQVMDTVGSAKAYLEILRQCAVHFRSFGKELRSALASSPCVLGWQHDLKAKSDEVRVVVCCLYVTGLH